MPKQAKLEDTARPDTNGISASMPQGDSLAALAQQITEKDILLSLNNDIAYVKTRDDLLSVIHPKLKTLFHTDDVFICRIDPQNDTLSPFLRVAGGRRINNREYDQVIDAHFSLTDRFIKTIVDSGLPVLYKLETVCNWADAPAYAKISKELGLREGLSTILFDGKQPIGVLTLWSEAEDAFSTHHIELIKQVSAQVSIIVNNILSEELLKEKEKELNILLSVSNAIASIRDKRNLVFVIQKTLQSFLKFSDIAITRFNLEKGTFKVFLEYCEKTNLQPDFEAIAYAEYPIADGIHDTIMNSSDTVVLSIKQLVKDGMVHIQFLERAGIKELAGIRLQHNNKVIGTMVLLSGDDNAFTPSNKRMIKEVSNYFATAMVNIIYNEQIEQQLHEIRSYKEQLEEEKQYLQDEISGGYTYNDIIGKSPPMKKIFHLLSQVAPTSSTVLILGETGTGKELIARAIHNSSPRKDKLMVKVNCAVLPPNLIESELFGHEKGSFTGATERRIGKFELANHGTLFLDEIGEIPPDLQVKLLRAIQEKEIERIGGKNTLNVDVRIIAATNRSLQQEVEQGRFRQDLFYRLNVFPVTLPALRDRKEDIPLLVSHFIERFAKNTGKKVRNISGKAMKELMAYSWPGNVRELEHLIERSVLMTNGATIKDLHLPTNNKQEIKSKLEDEYLKTHEENERDHIIKVLNKCNGKIYGPGGAADILGLRVSTLNSKIKKLGIKKNKLFS